MAQKNTKKNQEYVRALTLIINSLEGLYQIGAKSNGVKVGTLDLLYTLDDDRVHTQKSISEEWLLPYTTVNTITKQCEAEGNVELKPIPGKRRDKQICMTDKGRAFAKETLADVYKAENEAIQKTLDEYGPGFIEAFAAYGRHLKESFNEYVLDDAHRISNCDCSAECESGKEEKK